MADNISLKLTSSSSGLIQGDSPVSTLNRANEIVVTSYRGTVRTAFQAGTGLATGRRFHEPITFTKPLDRSTPVLNGMLVRNETAHGTFRWFRNDPSGVGTTQHYFTVRFADARITSVRLILPDTTLVASASLASYEEISMVFGEIEWNWIPDGIAVVDNWIASR